MIRDESAFLDSENVPAIMQGRFDVPWNFVGEVRTNASTMDCYCTKCNASPVTLRLRIVDHITVIVELRGYMFVTDYMIEVVIYFGICRKCDGVFWARSGPPFRRARALVRSL